MDFLFVAPRPTCLSGVVRMRFKGASTATASTVALGRSPGVEPLVIRSGAKHLKAAKALWPSNF